MAEPGVAGERDCGVVKKWSDGVVEKWSDGGCAEADLIVLRADLRPPC
jgi:hypothetical protein